MVQVLRMERVLFHLQESLILGDKVLQEPIVSTLLAQEVFLEQVIIEILVLEFSKSKQWIYTWILLIESEGIRVKLFQIKRLYRFHQLILFLLTR